jgi:hypothetical protein
MRFATLREGINTAKSSPLNTMRRDVLFLVSKTVAKTGTRNSEIAPSASVAMAVGNVNNIPLCSINVPRVIRFGYKMARNATA